VFLTAHRSAKKRGLLGKKEAIRNFDTNQEEKGRTVDMGEILLEGKDG